METTINPRSAASITDGRIRDLGTALRLAGFDCIAQACMSRPSNIRHFDRNPNDADRQMQLVAADLRQIAEMERLLEKLGATAPRRRPNTAAVLDELAALLGNR